MDFSVSDPLFFLVLLLLIYYLVLVLSLSSYAPVSGRHIAISVSVCLSVRLQKSHVKIQPDFSYMLPAAVAGCPMKAMQYVKIYVLPVL